MVSVSKIPIMIPMPTSPWVQIRKPNPEAGMRLFCFPYAGGGALIYRTWCDHLPQDVEVCSVQLPGRENRLGETPFNSTVPLVDELTKVLLPYLTKPFALFGHSMGARVAFELARKLRRHYGIEPVRLFVSGSPAPQVMSEDPPSYNLPDEEFIEELRRLNGTTKEVLDNPELMQLVLPLLRADFELVQTYSYTPDAPLDCPITAYGGLKDIEVPREDMEGWREHTTSYFTLRMLAGDHFFVNTNQRTLLESLSHELTRIGYRLQIGGLEE
jgi:medium-chain acyl-[acyl-carrier-protein] hydrolase